MGKIIKTLILDVKIFFISYFTEPFITALLLTLFLSAILLVIKKYGKHSLNISPYSLLFTFVSCFYFCELFYITLFSRMETTTQGLSNVFGEWTIFDGETSIYMNLKPVLNIILFIPLCIILFHIVKKAFNKIYTDKKMILYSVIISFSFSLFIELIQLIFNKGTFQLSDLTYNTLGGLIGIVLYITIIKIIKRIKNRTKDFINAKR